jgi:hypothetical protein
LRSKLCPSKPPQAASEEALMSQELKQSLKELNVRIENLKDYL